MGESAAPPEKGSGSTLAEGILRELKDQVAVDAARNWPLATLFAPTIATYEARQFAKGAATEGLVRAAIREFREYVAEAAFSIRRPAKGRQCDVLMLAMEPRQAHNHHPLMTWLEREGVCCALLTGARRPASVADGTVLPVVFAEGFAGPLGILRGMFESVGLFRSCRPIPDQSVERAWVLRRLRRKVVEGGRLFARASGILDFLAPRLVLTSDDCDPRARAVLLEAKRRGIPTIVTQFGVAGPYHLEWSHLAADTVAVLGQQQAGELEAHGISPSRLVVTGSPRFDTAEKLRISPLSRSILFASQPDAADCFGGEARRIELLKGIYSGFQRAGIEVVVRPHPDESIALHEKLARDAGLRARISVPARQSTHSALSECGGLVTFHSTLALEAALAARPVIFYRPVGAVASSAAEAFVKSAINAGWARSVEGPEDLAAILTDDHFFAPNLGQIDQFAFNSDGRATERVGRLILSRLVR